jgi:hypothetical protein
VLWFLHVFTSDVRCGTVGAQLVFGRIGDHASQRFPCLADLISVRKSCVLFADIVKSVVHLSLLQITDLLLSFALVPL